MDSRFAHPACLVLLCGLVALGPTTAEAACIGEHMRVHAQNMPQALAGRHNRMPAWARTRRRHRD